jgi:hypothetical protein
VLTVSSRGPQPVCRRAAQIRRCSRAGSSRGIRFGRLERSNKQANERRSCSLAVRHLRDQRQAVADETLKAAAAAFSEQPSSTARTSANRPANPSLALR